MNESNTKPNLEKNELNRLINLSSYLEFEVEADAGLEQLLRLVARVTKTSVASIVLINGDDVFHRVRLGHSSLEEARAGSPFDEVLVRGLPFLISNLALEPKFATSVFLRDSALQSFLGVPLYSKEGFMIGVLCVGDHSPRAFEDEQIQLLAKLSTQVSSHFDRVRLEKVLLEAEQMIDLQRIRMKEVERLAALGAMASGIAHEINNPLTIIQSKAVIMRELVRQGKYTPELIIETSDKIADTVTRITKIVKGLKTASRQGAEEPIVKVKLGEFVHDTLSFCEEKFRLSGIPLEVSPIHENLEVFCRPVELSQVLINLLNNAHDVTQGLTTPEKWVRISIQEMDGKVSIRVVDSGLGIAKNVLKSLFQPFFTTKPVGRGTGLGLSLSKALMESQGGTLQYVDDTVHTTFEIKLPSTD